MMGTSMYEWCTHRGGALGSGLVAVLYLVTQGIPNMATGYCIPQLVILHSWLTTSVPLADL